jgi:hypothetical protein
MAASPIQGIQVQPSYQHLLEDYVNSGCTAKDATGLRAQSADDFSGAINALSIHEVPV